MKLKNKVALITGAQRGIGKATAEVLAEAGATVVVNFLDDENAANEIVKNIIHGGGKAVTAQGDVTEKEQVDSIMNITEELGGIDILVNNAGVFPRKELFEINGEDWDYVHDINLKACFFCAQAAAAKASLQALQAELTRIRVERGSSTQDNLLLKQAKTAVDVAKLNLTYTTVRAPADGVISNMQVTTGTFAKQGTPLATLVTNDADLVADFREKSLLHVTEDSRALVVFDALPGEVFDAQIHDFEAGVSDGQLTPDGSLSKVEASISIGLSAFAPIAMLVAESIVKFPDVVSISFALILTLSNVADPSRSRVPFRSTLSLICISPEADNLRSPPVSTTLSKKVCCFSVSCRCLLLSCK